jgi:ribonuclease VapC
MAVDASAILAVLLNEADAEVHHIKLLSATKLWISPVNWWEVQVRMQSRFGDATAAAAADWMESSLKIVVEPITIDQARLAFTACVRFRGRPAKLNLGDCFALALAQSKDVPLLYKGNNFVHTGVRSA